MNTHAKKIQENKRLAVANSVAQKQSRRESFFHFADNRPEFVAQRKLQELSSNSPRGSQTMAYPDMANDSPRANQPAPLQAMADNYPAQLQTQATDKIFPVLQHYPDLDGTKRIDSVIYSIFDTSTGDVIYIGQTTADREFKRFQEHVDRDSWAPWYKDFNNFDTLPPDKWAYNYKVVEFLKDVTKFETTVAEQWWLEHYLKKDTKLWNDSTPCSIDNFNKRSGNPSLYDPTRIGVTKSYKPSMTAK